jgi:gliding motility-associated-like protein
VGNTYSWSPVTNLSNPSIGDPIANPSVTTFYTLTVTDASGCSEDGTVTVIVDDTPPVVAITNNTGSTTLTCTQLEINVTATGAIGYTWDNGLGNIASPSITAPGIYTVTGISANGCEAQAQIEITQDTGVDILVALAESEICAGEEVLITANSSTADAFTWTVIQSGASGASDGTAINTPSGIEISQTLDITGSVNGSVEYSVVPSLGACLGTPQIVTVTVLAPTIPSFNPVGPFCLNTSPTVLTSTSIEGVMGSWNPATISTSEEGTSSYLFTPNPDQCAASSSIDVTITPIPDVSFSADSLTGCAPHSVVLSSPSGTGVWTISNGAVINGNTATVSFNAPGCYDVTLQIEENGCTNSLTMTSYICIEEDPIAAFSATPDLFTDEDALVSFSNLSSGASSFVWDFGDGNTSTYINPSNLYDIVEEGAIVTLTAISDFGCTDVAQMIIPYDEQEVFYIPNTFTPDGDNFNQMFTPIFYSGFDPYNFEMLIFNRWGETVFESHDAEIGWDGTYGMQGVKASDGAYTWKITYKNPKTDERKVIVGHVTLIR